MANVTFSTLVEHKGHDVEIVTYEDSEGNVWNVALECRDCDVAIVECDSSKWADIW